MPLRLRPFVISRICYPYRAYAIKQVPTSCPQFFGRGFWACARPFPTNSKESLLSFSVFLGYNDILLLVVARERKLMINLKVVSRFPFPVSRFPFPVSRAHQQKAGVLPQAKLPSNLPVADCGLLSSVLTKLNNTWSLQSKLPSNPQDCGFPSPVFTRVNYHNLIHQFLARIPNIPGNMPLYTALIHAV